MSAYRPSLSASLRSSCFCLCCQTARAPWYTAQPLCCWCWLQETGSESMSAWYVFSSLGFYPVCPATPYYLIGAPTFPKARIGRFVIEAANVSPANHFIQSATWNGQPYTRNYITHQMILQGGTLRFVMGPSPNYQWGNQRDDCPPDVMKLQPTL